MPKCVKYLTHAGAEHAVGAMDSLAGYSVFFVRLLYSLTHKVIPSRHCVLFIYTAVSQRKSIE